jgi:modulator of FtsH protease
MNQDANAMNRTTSTTIPPDAAVRRPVSAAATVAAAADAGRVLRNTYALLAMTLLFSAGVAAASVAWRLPAPGMLFTLIGYFGLLFVVHWLRNSALALPAVFALTGFMGYTLGPLLSQVLAVPGGTQLVALAFGATAATFLALSAFALVTRRDFGFLGGFLFAGMIVALVAAVAAAFLELATLAIVVSAGVAFLSAGLILYETSRIVNGGETNYVLATVGLYVSIFNLFVSLLHLLGLGGSEE